MKDKKIKDRLLDLFDGDAGRVPLTEEELGQVLEDRLRSRQATGRVPMPADIEERSKAARPAAKRPRRSRLGHGTTSRDREVAEKLRILRSGPIRGKDVTKVKRPKVAVLEGAEDSKAESRVGHGILPRVVEPASKVGVAAVPEEEVAAKAKGRKTRRPGKEGR